MVVQHNMQAMNANRMLGVITGSQSKTTEKLASGYKINRAADDAAGLSISEKMRKQIRGLDRASTNAQDGVSAVQTAEGALTEVHSMLQRMNELATQAANGTNSEADRDAINAEIEQLTTEIDRVAETTKFNEIYLLKGDKGGATRTQTIAAHDAGIKGKLTDKGGGITSFEVDKPLKNGDKITIAGEEYTIGTSANHIEAGELNTSTDGYKISTDAVFKTAAMTAGDSVTFNGNTYTLTDKIAAADINWATGDTVSIGAKTYTVAATTNAATDQYTVVDLQKIIDTALADGKQVTSSKFHTNVTDKTSATAYQTDVLTTTKIVATL